MTPATRLLLGALLTLAALGAAIAIGSHREGYPVGVAVPEGDE